MSSLALSGESEKLNANDLLTGIQNIAKDFLSFCPRDVVLVVSVNVNLLFSKGRNLVVLKVIYHENL